MDLGSLDPSFEAFASLRHLRMRGFGRMVNCFRKLYVSYRSSSQIISNEASTATAAAAMAATAAVHPPPRAIRAGRALSLAARGSAAGQRHHLRRCEGAA